METTKLFGTEKISKILFRLAPPVMLAQLIQALYNIIDSLFVGRYSGSGLTALSIIYPIQILMIALAAHESGLDQEFISDVHKNSPDILRELYLSTRVVQHAIEAQEKIIRKIADNGSCVIVGRSADYVLKDYENVVRVFVHAPMEFRIGRVREVYGDTLKEAKRNIRRSDKARAAYYKHISGMRWGEAKNYELTVDSSVGTEKSAEIILAYISAHERKNSSPVR